MSLCPSVRPSKKNSNSKFSALVLDRDPGFSRGHQSDDEYQDEVDEEEVKDDKDDNVEAEEDDNYQTIKFLTFLESQAQAELNEDDDKDEDEKVDVED